MITRNRITEVISKALRIVQHDDGIKVDLSRAIFLIDIDILRETLVIDELLGSKVYSAGSISHISDVMIAFPEEVTVKEERFMYKFIQAMQDGEKL